MTGARGIVRIVSGLVLLGCAEGPLRVPTIPVLDEPRPGAWLAVVAGRDHACALDLQRRAYCWGSNAEGQLGVPETNTNCGTDEESAACSLVPMQVAAGIRFETIAAGALHTCAIAIDGAAYCWGSNGNGQLGDVGGSSPQPVRVHTTDTFRTISAGSDHTCGVTWAGDALCWGNNQNGQVGGERGIVAVPRPAKVELARAAGGFLDVSAGHRKSCGRTLDGSVLCWGAIWTHREGVLEFTLDTPFPEPVPSSPAFATVSVGGFATCGFDATGFVYCWSGNPNGQMGTGGSEGSVSPRRAGSTAEFVQLSAGLLQTCGVSRDGRGYCWGDNTFGQLGIGAEAVAERCGLQGLPCARRPVPVFGRHEWRSISTGPGQHTCGVTSLNNVYCWGLGTSGQRGDGTRIYREVVPIRVVPAR